MKQKALLICIGILLTNIPLIHKAQFTEIAGQLGVATPGQKDGGVAWGDFNMDGCPDLLVNTENNTWTTRLYQGSCGGAFRDVTATHANGLNGRFLERSVVWADINNDGYLDFARNDNPRFELYLNKGPNANPPYSFGDANQNPNFVVDLAQNIPVAGGIAGGMNTEGFGWLDYNNDGWLDLIAENHNFGIDIFENPANGTANFFHVTPNGQNKGLPRGGRSGDYMCLSDYNNDGFVDILARKENEYDLWQHNGNLNNPGFQADTSFNLQARNGNKGGVLFADFDNDGDFDLFWSDQDGNQIYVQDAQGNFLPTGEPATSTGFLLPGNGIDGCAAADVNHDGKIDLFLTDDTGTGWLFTNETSQGVLAFQRNNLNINLNGNGEGCVFGDYDNDGDMDLYVNMRNAANQLWRNDLNDRRYLKVRVLRDLGNGITRDDIGATIVLKDCNGAIKSGRRDVNGTRGHGSQDAHLIHFGLSDGPHAIYVVEVSFTNVNGTRPIRQMAIIPSLLTNQTLVIKDTDSSDLSLCFPLQTPLFTAFQLKPETQGLNLNWEVTADETARHFQVERSLDGTNFETIANVEALQNGKQINQYDWVETTRFNTSVWYRIRREAMDGSQQYSAVLEATAVKTLEFQTWPNPVASGTPFKIKMESSQGGTALIRILNTSGKEVRRKEVEMLPGMAVTQINPEGMTAGLYVVELRYAGRLWAKKLVLQP